jgi:hypothetical protein
MEFIKIGKNYMIKNSNGRIVSEKEKLELENKELVLKDITGCECQKETTKKISKNKKRIKELEQEEPFITDVAKKYEYLKDNEEYNKIKEPIKIKTALQDKENADDTIKETNKSI